MSGLNADDGGIRGALVMDLGFDEAGLEEHGLKLYGGLDFHAFDDVGPHGVAIDDF